MVFVFIVRHDRFDFCHRHHRQEPAKQQKQGHEQTEAANKHPNIYIGRPEIPPRGRQEIPA